MSSYIYSVQTILYDDVGYMIRRMYVCVMCINYIYMYIITYYAYVAYIYIYIYQSRS